MDDLMIPSSAFLFLDMGLLVLLLLWKANGNGMTAISKTRSKKKLVNVKKGSPVFKL